MSLTFQREDLLVPPGTLRAWQGPDALKFRSAIAAECDNLVLTAQLTGEARNPLKCHASVLPYHGRDRRIRRYVTETEASYRLRLAKWKQIWSSAGRAWGLLRQVRIFLSPYGRPTLRCVSTNGDGSRSQWFTLAPGDPTKDYFLNDQPDPEFSRHVESPGNWNWDGNYTARSRSWLIIYADGLTLPAQTKWNQSTWGGGKWTPAFGLTSSVFTDIVSLWNDFKGAQTAFWGIAFVRDPALLDPTGSGAGYPDGTWWQTNPATQPADVQFVYRRGKVP